jgi:hypothetical protein
MKMETGVYLSAFKCIDFFFFNSRMEFSLSPVPSLAFMNVYVLQTPINLAARMLFTIGSFMVSLQGVSDSLSGLVVSARKAAQVHSEFSKYSKEILKVTCAKKTSNQHAVFSESVPWPYSAKRNRNSLQFMSRNVSPLDILSIC